MDTDANRQDQKSRADTMQQLRQLLVINFSDEELRNLALPMFEGLYAACQETKNYYQHRHMQFEAEFFDRYARLIEKQFGLRGNNVMTGRHPFISAKTPTDTPTPSTTPTPTPSTTPTPTPSTTPTPTPTDTPTPTPTDTPTPTPTDTPTPTRELTNADTDTNSHARANQHGDTNSD